MRITAVLALLVFLFTGCSRAASSSEPTSTIPYKPSSTTTVLTQRQETDLVKKIVLYNGDIPGWEGHIWTREEFEELNASERIGCEIAKKCNADLSSPLFQLSTYDSLVGDHFVKELGGFSAGFQATIDTTAVFFETEESLAGDLTKVLDPSFEACMDVNIREYLIKTYVEAGMTNPQVSIVTTHVPLDGYDPNTTAIIRQVGHIEFVDAVGKKEKITSTGDLVFSKYGRLLLAVNIDWATQTPNNDLPRLIIEKMRANAEKHLVGFVQ